MSSCSAQLPMPSSSNGAKGPSPHKFAVDLFSKLSYSSSWTFRSLHQFKGYFHLQNPFNCSTEEHLLSLQQEGIIWAMKWYTKRWMSRVEFYKHLPNDKSAQLKSYMWGLITVSDAIYLHRDIFKEEIGKITLWIGVRDERLPLISNTNWVKKYPLEIIQLLSLVDLHYKKKIVLRY